MYTTARIRRAALSDIPRRPSAPTWKPDIQELLAEGHQESSHRSPFLHIIEKNKFPSPFPKPSPFLTFHLIFNVFWSPSYKKFEFFPLPSFLPPKSPPGFKKKAQLPKNRIQRLRHFHPHCLRDHKVTNFFFLPRSIINSRFPPFLQGIRVSWLKVLFQSEKRKFCARLNLLPPFLRGCKAVTYFRPALKTPEINGRIGGLEVRLHELFLFNIFFIFWGKRGW